MAPLDLLIRLGAAALCGAAAGVQVELRERPGGLRAHMLTAVGAAGFCATAAGVSETDEVIRVIQGVTSGVGFIGAAAVLRESGRVRGTATAASLWITAAAGCGAGLGQLWTAGGLAAFAAIVHLAALRLERRMKPLTESRAAADDAQGP